MRLGALTGLGCLLLMSCSPSDPRPSPLPQITGEAAPRPSAISSAASVPGWTTSGGDFLLLGKQAPAFSATELGGSDISLESLRGKWTILGFEGDSSAAGETTYMQALSSAVDADPDLDFLSIRQAASGSSGTPSVMDAEGKIAAAFGVTDFPTYLLIGPDLTIEAIRGALSSTPDNGIKDVIRGVAEIKKQIADPT